MEGLSAVFSWEAVVTLTILAVAIYDLRTRRISIRKGMESLSMGGCACCIMIQPVRRSGDLLLACLSVVSPQVHK